MLLNIVHFVTNLSLLEGDLTERFLRYDFGGLIFGGAYKWRGLFSEFYGILSVN